MDGTTAMLIFIDFYGFLGCVFGAVVVFSDFGDRELNMRKIEKNIKALKKYIKKSKGIDQKQADQISTLIKEILSLLRQKKISRE